MTRARTAAVSFLLLLALPACSGGEDRTAAPASTASAVTPTATPLPAGDDRAVCRKNADTGNTFDTDPAVNLANGELASKAKDPGIARAGYRLVEAAVAAQDAKDTIDANLALHRAQLGVAEACVSLFGDGPW